jgi:choline dehydrogenase-like flavoprotein
MSPAIHEVFLPTGGHANAFNVRSPANWAKSWIAAGLFDLGPAVRRVLLGSSVVDHGALANDRAALESAIRETAACVHHPAGSCRIGRAADPFAVVDPQCRVHGVQALRVADASIMPTIVTAGTHLTALMIGEKAADMIRGDWHGARSDVRGSTAEVVTRAPAATGRARATSGTAGSKE